MYLWPSYSEIWCFAFNFGGRVIISWSWGDSCAGRQRKIDIFIAWFNIFSPGVYSKIKINYGSYISSSISAWADGQIGRRHLIFNCILYRSRVFIRTFRNYSNEFVIRFCVWIGTNVDMSDGEPQVWTMYSCRNRKPIETLLYLYWCAAPNTTEVKLHK